MVMNIIFIVYASSVQSIISYTDVVGCLPLAKIHQIKIILPRITGHAVGSCVVLTHLKDFRLINCEFLPSDYGSSFLG